LLSLREGFAKLQTFTTQRLKVRPMALADAEDYFEIKSDPMVTEQYGAEPETSIDRTRRWVEDRIANREKREGMFWVYELKDGAKVVGGCCYWHIDEGSRCAELGYELNRTYWHQGLTSEALLPVISFGFDGFGLNRIEACPLAENGPSNRLLQRLGFKYEGTFRERVLFRGRFIDQVYYSLLREDPRPGANGPGPTGKDRGNQGGPE